MIDGSRPINMPISLYSKPSASPREISSRSGNVSITRTAGILSHRTIKIKCYDRLNPPLHADGVTRCSALTLRRLQFACLLQLQLGKRSPKIIVKLIA
jgi:hypothetical protein